VTQTSRLDRLRHAGSYSTRSGCARSQLTRHPRSGSFTNASCAARLAPWSTMLPMRRVSSHSCCKTSAVSLPPTALGSADRTCPPSGAVLRSPARPSSRANYGKAKGAACSPSSSIARSASVSGAVARQPARCCSGCALVVSGWRSSQWPAMAARLRRPRLRRVVRVGCRSVVRRGGAVAADRCAADAVLTQAVDTADARGAGPSAGSHPRQPQGASRAVGRPWRARARGGRAACAEPR